MSALEESRAQLDKLQGRMKEYQEQLKAAADPQKRADIKSKLAIYRAAIQDIQIQIDYLDPPKERRPQKRWQGKINIGSQSWDWLERLGMTCSDLEGHSWQQVESGDLIKLGASMAQLQSWIAEGAQRLTDRQRFYLDFYYNQGLSMRMIAQKTGVDRSTVSREVKRGMARMQKWVDAKKLILSCVDGEGRFDWVRCLTRVSVLTDRQRQLMLMVYDQSSESYIELANRLKLDRSTVSRTMSRAKCTLKNWILKEQSGSG